jgi:DNA-binding CsgD family transcriptional regulator
MRRSSMPTQGRIAGDGSVGLPDVIAAIGNDRFGPQMMSFLHRLCGADHCAMFVITENALSEVTTASLDGSDAAHRAVSRYIGQEYWRRDPTLSQARRHDRTLGPAVIRVDISCQMPPELRRAIYSQVRERLLICGDAAGPAMALSIIRSRNRGRFADAEVACVAAVADTLLALLAKHAERFSPVPSIAVALASLDDIERTIVAAPEALPRREIEVCARIVYGQTTAGIALTLGIGEESVMTYRKRAYQRLNISSQRELLMWYLGLRTSPRLHCWQPGFDHQMVSGAAV